MNIIPPSVFSAHPAYAYLRGLGAGRIDIEKIFDAFAGHVPALRLIEGKIADLRALGFADPVKMITSLPAILGYAIENIRGKIADLRALGFADPVKMITSSPAILGYASLRMHLCGGIVLSFSPGCISLFNFLINKNPEAVAAAAIISDDNLRAAVRARLRHRPSENIELIDADCTHPIAVAYFKYRPGNPKTEGAIS